MRVRAKDSIAVSGIVPLDVPQCVSCEAWAGGDPFFVGTGRHILRAGHQDLSSRIYE